MIESSKYLDNQVLKINLMTHGFIYARSYLSRCACRETIPIITESPTLDLPTDGGGVYSQVLCDIPESLQRAGSSICQLLAQTSGKFLDHISPMTQEIIRYENGAALSRHRDNEGNAKSKMLITLCGSAIMGVEGGTFEVQEGDLVILRGREFLDIPTPEHETSSNQNRYVLLTEPNYTDAG